MQEHLGKKYNAIEAEDEISGNGELKIYDMAGGEAQAKLDDWRGEGGEREKIEHWLTRDESKLNRFEAERSAPSPAAMIAYLVEREVLPEAQYYVHIDW